MTDLIIGLLGGGALVQLASLLTTWRQNRRQMAASALGGEVEALEKTIAVLNSNFEQATERHRRETNELRDELERLRRECSSLRAEVMRLRENRLRDSLRLRGGQQLSLPLD